MVMTVRAAAVSTGCTGRPGSPRMSAPSRSAAASRSWSPSSAASPGPAARASITAHGVVSGVMGRVRTIARSQRDPAPRYSYGSRPTSASINVSRRAWATTAASAV